MKIHIINIKILLSTVKTNLDQEWVEKEVKSIQISVLIMIPNV